MTHHIETISSENVRGITNTVDLGPKTIIIGPNGAGKSSIMHTGSLAVDGYIPDASDSNKSSDYIFANSSGDTMGAAAVVDGKMVSRAWKKGKGKSVSQKVTVDGHDTNKGGAAALIEMALGKGRVLVDVPAFWNEPPSQQIRMILKAHIDPKTLEDIIEQEQVARDKKNALSDERRAAEKSLENLTEQISMTEQPEGHLEHITEALVNLRQTERDLQKRISDSQANERMRSKMQSLVDQLPEYENSLLEVDAKLELQAKVSDPKPAIEEHATLEPKKPAERLQEGVIAETVRNVCDQLDVIAAEDDSSFLPLGIMDAHTQLQSILPDPKADKAYAEALDEWHTKKAFLKRELSDYMTKANELANEKALLVDRIASAQDAGEKLVSIGPGVDNNDVAAQTTVVAKIEEQTALISPLQKRAALTEAQECARLDIERIIGEEETAGTALAVITTHQTDLVEGACDYLGALSKDVLPYGNLRLEVDGKKLRIYWAMTKDKRVRRHTLSGGEKALFDAAIGHALGPEACVAIEAAECDDEHLISLLDHLGPQDFQVVIMTCHQPAFDIPEAWTKIHIG